MRPTSPVTLLGTVLTNLVGRVIAAGMAALAIARHRRKPLHPIGVVHQATLRRRGSPERTGASLIDEPGEDVALVRISRSAGLRPPLPDVNGLAIRILRHDVGHDDILMSTTGSTHLGRYVMRAHRAIARGFFGTLVPYRSPTGPLHLGASMGRSGEWVLAFARPFGPWHPFADLDVGDPEGELQVSFDAIRFVPDGLQHYAWHARLRGPAYAAARRTRGQAH